jgi:hemerythrin-like domain-containing protein
MLHEHEQGRLLIRRMVESLDAAAEGSAVAVAALRRAVAEYVSLLRQHIDKEDNVLFVMAESALHPERVEAMSAAFERVESEHAEPDRHERYLALAEELTRRAADRK